ncbi:MAG: DUF362 domain-containing protein [Candidatus Woesearchaeota archaeon]
MENSNEPIVASTIIRRQFKHELITKTKKSMELAKIYDVIKKNNILIKIDCSSNHLIPGINTSPYMLEAVIKNIKYKLPESKIIVADYINNSNNFKTWGVADICKNNNVKLINLKHVKKEKINNIKIPKILLEVDHVISISPLRTDKKYQIYTPISNLLNITNNNIEIKKKLKTILENINLSFAIIDATISFIEDKNIKKTVIMDTIISSKDFLAISNTASNIFSINYKKIKHLEIANKLNYGNPFYKLIGDFSEQKINLKKEKRNIIEKIKEYFWYKFKAKKLAKKTIEKNILYTLEFESLIK